MNDREEIYLKHSYLTTGSKIGASGSKKEEGQPSKSREALSIIKIILLH